MVNKSKYKTVDEWRKADKKAYNAARDSGLLSEICDMFDWRKPNSRKPTGYWTKEQCIIAIASCKKKKDISLNFSPVVNVARKNGWWGELTAHYPKLKRNWTKDELRNEASKYSSISDFIKGNRAAYTQCINRKYLYEFFSNNNI